MRPYVLRLDSAFALFRFRRRLQSHPHRDIETDVAATQRKQSTVRSMQTFSVLSSLPKGRSRETHQFRRAATEDDLTVVDARSDDEDPTVFTPTLVKTVLVACIGAFLFGYHVSVVNGPLDAIAADLGFSQNAVLKGSVVSTLLAGAAVGSLSGGRLADSLGRRLALGLDTVLMITGALFSALSHNLAFMIVGRLIAGVSIGISSSIVPLYISEVSPTSIRGLLGSASQLFIVTGILAALCINVVLPASSWRTMFLISVIPAVLLAVGMSVSPESPRWLITNGKKEAAQRVMQQLWKKVDPSIESLHKSDDGRRPGIRQKHISIIVIACSLFAFQQFSGVNAITYYSTKVFKDAGMQNDTMASAAVGVVNVLGTLLASVLIDQSGRKQLLGMSFIGMGLAMALMATGFSQPLFESYRSVVALAGTLLYIFWFGLGVGPIPSLVVPEIAPSEIRGSAVSFALTTHWVTNFAIGQLFLPCVEQFGISAVYRFFSFVSFAAAVFVFRAMVETKGRSLEEIEKVTVS